MKVAQKKIIQSGKWQFADISNTVLYQYVTFSYVIRMKELQTQIINARKLSALEADSAQPVKEFPIFYETGMVITVFIRFCGWTLPKACGIKFTASSHVFDRQFY